MRIILLHAKGDAAAEPIAAALAGQDLIRFAVSDRDSGLRLFDARVLLVWSEAAKALGFARFQALCTQAAAVGMVCVGAAAPAEYEGRRVVWSPREAGPAGLMAMLSAGAAPEEGARPALQPLTAAAGFFAAMGVLAAASPAPLAQPAALTRRESDRGGARRTVQAVSAAIRHSEAASLAPAAAAIELGSPPRELQPARSAAALLEAWALRPAEAQRDPPPASQQTRPLWDFGLRAQR